MKNPNGQSTSEYSDNEGSNVTAQKSADEDSWVNVSESQGEPSEPREGSESPSHHSENANDAFLCTNKSEKELMQQEVTSRKLEAEVISLRKERAAFLSGNTELDFYLKEMMDLTQTNLRLEKESDQLHEEIGDLKAEIELLQAEKRATEDLLNRELNDREQAHLLLLNLVESLQDRVETLEAVLSEQNTFY